MYFCSYRTKGLEKVLRKTLRKYQLCLGIVETKGKNIFLKLSKSRKHVTHSKDASGANPLDTVQCQDSRVAHE